MRRMVIRRGLAAAWRPIVAARRDIGPRFDRQLTHSLRPRRCRLSLSAQSDERRREVAGAHSIQPRYGDCSPHLFSASGGPANAAVLDPPCPCTRCLGLGHFPDDSAAVFPHPQPSEHASAVGVVGRTSGGDLRPTRDRRAPLASLIGAGRCAPPWLFAGSSRRHHA